MKNAKVTIKPTEITAINFKAPKPVAPGTSVKLRMECKFIAGVNQNSPTNGMAKITFMINSEEGDRIIEIETVTPVIASTYIDNLQDVIKKDFGQVILLAANEKVRSIFQTLGMKLNFPGISLPYGEQDVAGGSDEDGLDDILKNYGKI